MSNVEKLNILRDFILSHLGDDDNNIFNLEYDDKKLTCKLDAIYNDSLIIFRDIVTNDVVELTKASMPNLIYSLNWKTNLF